MTTNPILEELWKIKDDLAREAGYDTHQFFENLRKWATEHPHSGPVVRNAAELRQLVAEKGAQQYPQLSPKAALVRETPLRKRKPR